MGALKWMFTFKGTTVRC